MAGDFAAYRNPVPAIRVYCWVNQSLGRRVVGHSHRIGTWNLENLFKPPNEFAPKTEGEYQAKLDALAGAIARMDPDVLAVQEVGDPVALGELPDRVGGTWHIETAAPEAGTTHTIRVGVLSRLPLTTFDPVAAFPEKLRAIQQGDKQADTTTAMGRPALHVRVRIHDTDIDLITAHFKSKLLTFPDDRFTPLDEDERARFGAYALYRRAAEAVTVRAAATDLLTNDHEASVIVLGDLNDEVEAATTQILNGPPGSEIGRSAPAALTTPTKVTCNGCGIWPHASPKPNASAANIGDATN